MCDDTLGLADALFGLLDNVVWGLVGKADNDGSLGSDSHGGSGEDCGQDGKGCEAHFERVDRVLRNVCERSLNQVLCSAAVVCRGVLDVIRKVEGLHVIQPTNRRRRHAVGERPITAASTIIRAWHSAHSSAHSSAHPTSQRSP